MSKYVSSLVYKASLTKNDCYYPLSEKKYWKIPLGVNGNPSWYFPILFFRQRVIHQSSQFDLVICLRTCLNDNTKPKKIVVALWLTASGSIYLPMYWFLPQFMIFCQKWMKSHIYLSIDFFCRTRAILLIIKKQQLYFTLR